MIEAFEMVPEDLKQRLNSHYVTGFCDWTSGEYQKFIRSFKKRDLGDIDGMAEDIESKTPEQVAAYMDVFLKRFRELKERDIVIMKFEKKTFEQKTLESIKDFDPNHDYHCFVQENDYFTTHSYLALMRQAQ